MRKIMLIAAALACGIIASGQEMRITFAGKGESTAIDWITATNLSTNQSVTLPGNGTLILTAANGIPDFWANVGGFSIYPNPFTDRASLTVESPIQQKAMITLRNVLGQVIIRKEQALNPGFEMFDILVQKPGLYSVTISCERLSTTSKIICLETGRSQDGIIYRGNRQSDPLPASGLKNGHGVSSGYPLFYTTGDILSFTVSSGSSTTIFTDSPNDSRQYEVELYSCSDPGGNNYPVVVIGDQTWMAKNLAYLPSVSGSYSGQASIPFYYVYGYEGTSVSQAQATSNYNTYGVLYNWEAAQAACPEGWHLPSDGDWQILESRLGMNATDISNFGWRNSGNAGGQLKESGTGHWYMPNEGATNSTGFSGLPGSSRGVEEGFFSIGYRAYFWTSTQSEPTTAMFRGLYYDLGGVERGNDSRVMGFSVRCLKNGQDFVRIPVITTDPVTEITSGTAVSGGLITSDGGGTVTSRGVCWNSAGDPSINDDKTNDGSGTGPFSSTLTGLVAGTPYYIRAYATNSAGTAYGEQLLFTTNSTAVLATVTTADITGILQGWAAGGGDVTDDGGATVTAKGVCWNSSPNPTTDNPKTNDGTGTGPFVSALTGLIPSTLFYVRAYAINSAGTAYGEEKQFTTEFAADLAIVTTAIITDITQNSATGGGDVTDDGGATVTARGVCWNTSGNPTLADDKTTDGTGIGPFISSMNGLTAGTPYYVRAYAVNNEGTAYGEERQFTTAGAGGDGTITDSRDGQVYKITVINTQTWLAENLKYLPSVSPSSAGSTTDPYYYVYSYQGSSPDAAKSTFQFNNSGVLYNWEAAKIACPPGYRLPSDGEWQDLVNFLGGDAGAKMKELGTAHWFAPNSSATNSSGFTAIPGGMRDSNGSFYYYPDAYFWSSSTSIDTTSWFYFLYYNYNDLFRNNWERNCALSVRCLKN